MDSARFDSLTRSLSTAGSRRGVLAAVLGGSLGLLGWHADEDAVAHNAKKACKKKSGKAKKKCLKKARQHNATHTTSPAPAICIPQCRGKLCGPDGCGGECGVPCASGQLCARGQCVLGQGSCAAGADGCVTGSSSCGVSCFCFTSMANQTRCGQFVSGVACGQCTSDAGCETLFPTIPGVFCAKDTAVEGNCCEGPEEEGFCAQPCADPF